MISVCRGGAVSWILSAPPSSPSHKTGHDETRGTVTTPNNPSTANLEQPTADTDDSPCIGAETTPEVTVVQADYIPDRWDGA